MGINYAYSNYDNSSRLKYFTNQTLIATLIYIYARLYGNYQVEYFNNELSGRLRSL